MRLIDAAPNRPGIAMMIWCCSMPPEYAETEAQHGIKVEDIDSQRMVVIHIRQGKGAPRSGCAAHPRKLLEERVAQLVAMEEAARLSFSQHRGPAGRRPVHLRQDRLARLLTPRLRAPDFEKKIHPHTLRHELCHRHPLEAGTDPAHHSAADGPCRRLRGYNRLPPKLPLPASPPCGHQPAGADRASHRTAGQEAMSRPPFEVAEHRSHHW